MGRGDLEIVQRFFELARADDWSRLELLAADVAYFPTPETMDAGERRGRNAFRRYVEAFFGEAWSDDAGYEATDIREHGSRVIARIEFHGEGRTSGLELSGRVFQVFTLSDGEIVRIEDYIDRAEALAAATREG
jgi:ketosteroid isomerase-like protein